jgi:hypothetical protein
MFRNGVGAIDGGDKDLNARARLALSHDPKDRRRKIKRDGTGLCEGVAIYPGI